MSDAELNLLAEDADDLTEAAREALRNEYARRGLTMPEPQTGEWDAQELVVVGRFRDLHEALLAKGQFDSAGIPSYLVDDNMVRIDWFISNLLGGVKLAVPAEHEGDARGLLAEPIPEDFDVGDEEPTQDPL